VGVVEGLGVAARVAAPEAVGLRRAVEVGERVLLALLEGVAPGGEREKVMRAVAVLVVVVLAVMLVEPLRLGERVVTFTEAVAPPPPLRPSGVPVGVLYTDTLTDRTPEGVGRVLGVLEMLGQAEEEGLEAVDLEALGELELRGVLVAAAGERVAAAALGVAPALPVPPHPPPLLLKRPALLRLPEEEMVGVPVGASPLALALAVALPLRGADTLPC
jgi:hypothetical protein